MSLHFRFQYVDAALIGAGAPILSERFELFPDVPRRSLGVYIKENLFPNWIALKTDSVSLHFRFEYEDAVPIGAGAPILSERFELFHDVLRLSLGVYI